MAASHDSVSSNISAGEKSRVLIIGDDEAQGQLLSEILATDNIDSTLATSGEQALELHQSYRPDVLLIDVALSGTNGFQTARKIRALNPDIFVPIIFVSSLESPESIVSCFESGGVDCLIKPYNPAVLSLKIHTFREISQLYKTVKQQRDKLAAHNRYLESSYATAEKVFSKVMQSDVLKSEAIKYFLSPIAIFNGDILLAAYRPSGELHVMLGDFTGHGLSAAIGAIPVSDIFYGMTEKGFSLGEIIEEINAKLIKILPRGLFLAASLIKYSRDSRRMTVWNAGLPDVLVFGNNGDIHTRVTSKHCPLGVDSTLSLAQSMDVFQLQEGDRLLMFTDGLIEAKNPASELYGMERVLEVIKSNPRGWKIDSIHSELVSFVGNKAIEDDIAVIEINLDTMTRPTLAKKNQEYPKPIVNAEWKVRYCFGADILRQADPLPSIVQTLMELQKLHRYKQDIFVILKELFVNALDHGLLGLDSLIKVGPNGFSNYMKERASRLANLQDGIVSIEIIHKAHPAGGLLDVYVFDNGDGFDVKQIIDNHGQENSGYHGRGLLLVKSICESLTFNEKGNEVHARYVWQA